MITYQRENFYEVCRTDCVGSARILNLVAVRLNSISKQAAAGQPRISRQGRAW
jgi:hypothetical protein